jgi:hypothetical protein
MSLHDGKLIQENLFPIGFRENLLLGVGMGMAAIAAIILILAGIATFRRKWPVSGWITGVLVGLILLGTIVGGALAGDAAPRIRARYQATVHTTAIQNITPFNKVVSTGPVDITYISSPTYAANLHYSGNPSPSLVKTQVRNGVLYIDSTALGNDKHCTMLCLYPRYDMTIQIYAPNVENLQTPPHTDVFYPPAPSKV